MRYSILLLVAATVSACSTPLPVDPPASTSSSMPVEVANTQLTSGDSPATPAPSAAPQGPSVPMLTGVVMAPQNFLAPGESPKRFLLGLEGQQKPLANTEVFVTDEKGQSLGIKGTTDAEGRFTLTLTLELAGRPLIINAFAVDASGQRVTLRSLARTSTDGNPAGGTDETKVDFASTVVTQHALTSGLTEFSAETYAQIVAKLEEILTPEKMAQFDLANAGDVLRELSNVVDSAPELGTAFKGFGNSDAGRYNNHSGSRKIARVVLTGDYTITNQQELDAIRAANEIQGNLLFIAMDPTFNLNLPNLEVVSGNVVIANVGLHTDLQGLSSLRSVGGSLRIFAPTLTSVDGLEKVRTIGNGLLLRPENSPPLALTNLNGLRYVQTVVGKFHIGTAMSLTALPTFPNLSTVGGLRVEDSGLTSLSTLVGITINGELEIINDDSLSALPNFTTGALTSINISHNALLTNSGVRTFTDPLALANPSLTVRVRSNGPS